MKFTYNLIKESNLSVAWAKAFINTISSKAGTISPLVVIIQNLKEDCKIENSIIRVILSDELQNKKVTQIETVSGTIFPESYWNPKTSRQTLFNRYIKCWPRIKKCPSNRRGTYFERLISYENDENYINQLEHIITTWHKGNHRHSALQASIFDPRKDHKNQRQLGFPCLQQIAFNPLGVNGKDGLVLTGFYANQYIFEKAYGNYLGLYRMGLFMAQEMGLELKQIVCIANVAKYADSSKFSMKVFGGLKNKLIEILNLKEI